MEQVNPIESGKSGQGSSEAWEWTKAIVIAVALIIVIRWLIFAPFIVDGDSMQPNFQTGERLIVNKFMYQFFSEPKRGDVIVFHASEEKDFIKRVIAVPGEKVRIEGDTVYINDQPLEEPYLQEVLDQAAASGTLYNIRGDFAEQTVPENAVFVLGDNRSNSTDSRYIGMIEYEQIVGRADIKFWPLSSIGLVK